ncbi:MAG: HD domain-containing phosphohydrolase [Candidatus Zhuqueibacterota bacterium]
MSLKYWNLYKNPFDGAPASHEIFVRNSLIENLHTILAGIQQHKELMAVVGDFGVGKTTFINYFLQHIHEQHFKTLFIANPLGLMHEFYPFLLTQLGVKAFPASFTQQSELVSRRLSQLSQSFRKLIIVIDEAHLMQEPSVFEKLRLLITTQINGRYFVHLILSGHLELNAIIDRLPQFRQRLFSTIEISNLTSEETREYIDHKIQAAGNQSENIFNADAIQKIFEHEQGNPGGIEKLCTKCLFAGCEKKLKRIDSALVADLTARKSAPPLSSETLSPNTNRAIRTIAPEPRPNVGAPIVVDTLYKFSGSDPGTPPDIEKLCEMCPDAVLDIKLRPNDASLVTDSVIQQSTQRPVTATSPAHSSHDVRPIHQGSARTATTGNVAEKASQTRPDEMKSGAVFTLPVSDAEFYALLNAKVNEKYVSASENRKVALLDLWQIAQNLHIRLSRDKSLLKLAMDSPSKYTIGSHSVNVAILVAFVSPALLSEPDKRLLATTTALIHDIGMMKLSEAVVYKKSQLTAEEAALVKHHPVWGRNLVRTLAALHSDDMIHEMANIILQEHERSGGIGYPNQKRLKDINQLSQIIGLCDYFEAMIHDRPWRPRMNPTAAVNNLIKLDKKYFQSQLKKVLVTKISFYPIGSTVLLNTGEIAEVIDINEHQPLRPIVKIIQSASEGNSKLPDTRNLMDYPLIHISKIAEQIIT